MPLKATTHLCLSMLVWICICFGVCLQIVRLAATCQYSDLWACALGVLDTLLCFRSFRNSILSPAYLFRHLFVFLFNYHSLNSHRKTKTPSLNFQNCTNKYRKNHFLWIINISFFFIVFYLIFSVYFYNFSFFFFFFKLYDFKLRPNREHYSRQNTNKPRVK